MQEHLDTLESLIAAIEREQSQHPDRVGAALARARTETDPRVRITALERVPPAAVTHSEWQTFIMDALRDADYMVRYTAAEAAGRVNLSGAIPELMRLLSDRNSMVRLSAVEILGEMRAHGTAPAVALRLATDTSRRVRGYAARALASIAGESAIPVLRERLDHEPNRWASTWIALALYHLGQHEMLPLLLRRLRSKDDYVRYSLVNGIEDVAQESDCRPLLSALRAGLDRETNHFAREFWRGAISRITAACPGADCMPKSA